MNSLDRGVISLDIARNGAQSSQIGGKSAPWSLNQVLKATVLNNSPEGKLLQIEGTNYRIQTNTAAEPGKSLLLRVASLSPQVELVFVDSFRNGSRAEPNPAAILSAKLLQKTQQESKKNTSNLLFFMKLFNFSDLQSLPNETLSLLNSLKKKLIRSEDLSNTSKLKPALRQSGLLLESKLMSLESRQQASSPEFDGDLKAILFQLFKSLNRKPTSLTQGASRASTYPGHGLSVYRANEQESGNVKTQLMHEVEEVLSKIVMQQKNTLEESGEDRQRWFFELPVNFRSQLLSIPVTVYRDNASRNEFSNESSWGAEFSLELQNSGFINANVSIANTSVSISLRSELNKTAQYLNQQRDALRDSLQNCGLTLLEFESSQLISGQP